MPEIVQRQLLNSQAIDEIEKNCVAKCHENWIHLLQKEPEKFPYFDNLKKVESNAYYLAKEYSDNLKKNLVSRNEENLAIANRLIQDTTHYDFIERLERSALTNELFVNMLIDIVRKRVDWAYQLATYREKSRHDDGMEEIKDRVARTEQKVDRTEQKVDRLLALANNNGQIIAAAAVALQPEAPISIPANPLPQPQQSHSNAAQQTQTAPTAIVKSSPETPKSDSRKRARTTAPKSSPSPKQQRYEPPVATAPRRVQTPNTPETPQRGLWKYVSDDECKQLRTQNYFSDKFIKAILPKIYSAAELLLPMKELPSEKKAEFLKIMAHFYGTSIAWEKSFNSVMNSLRSSRRSEIFKAIGKTKGYGIASNGKNYFYKLSTKMCFKNDECHASGNLRTKNIGNVAIPEICGSFEYILLIEKEKVKAKLQKLYPDGRIQIV